MADPSDRLRAAAERHRRDAAEWTERATMREPGTASHDVCLTSARLARLRARRADLDAEIREAARADRAAVARMLRTWTAADAAADVAQAPA